MNSLTISSQVSFWKIPNSSTLRDQQLIKDDPEIKNHLGAPGLLRDPLLIEAAPSPPKSQQKSASCFP